MPSISTDLQLLHPQFSPQISHLGFLLLEVSLLLVQNQLELLLGKPGHRGSALLKDADELLHGVF